MDTSSPPPHQLDDILSTLQLDSRLQTLEHKALSLRHTLRKMTATSNLRDDADADPSDDMDVDFNLLLPSEPPAVVHSARVMSITKVTAGPRLVDVPASPRSSARSSLASSVAGSLRRVPGPRSSTSSTSSATSYGSLKTKRSYSDWRASRTLSAAFAEPAVSSPPKESMIGRSKSVLGSYLGRRFRS